MQGGFKIDQNNKNIVIALETVTIIILLAIDLLLAGRPVLEGWAHLLQFHLTGFNAFFPEVTARFFEQLPIGIAWLFELLGCNDIMGLALVFSLIILAKYLAARWAILPLIKNPITRWILATLAAIMIPWNEQWYAHNLACQFASLFMLITFGTCIRVYIQDRFSISWFLITTTSLLISLLTYEALILCAIMIPVVIHLSFAPTKIVQNLKNLFRTMAPIILGVILYVLFYYWTETHTTGMTYHQQLLSGVQPIRRPFQLITHLYQTAYFNSAWTYPFLMLFLMTLMDKKRGAIQLFTIGTALFLLPLLSLIYAVNFYFLSDLERTCFPIGFGFFLLAVAAAARFAPSKTDMPYLPTGIILVIAMLIGTMVNAYTAYQPYQLERSVINQLKPLILNNNAHTVLVRDWTGRLGDRYTFQYMNTLGNALMLEGITPLNLSLCTPENIDRIHPMMERFLSHTQVPHCNELNQGTTPTFVINIRDTNNPLNPVAIPHGFEEGVNTSITKGSLGGEEIQGNTNFHWINAPQASISIENKTTENLSVVWSANFTSPPCNKKTQIKLLLDKRALIFPVNATGPTPYSFTTKIKAKTIKNINFQVTGSICQYGNPPGDFYVGILGMEAHPLLFLG